MLIRNHSRDYVVLNPFTPISATETNRFYSVLCQTIFLINGDPLRSERVKWDTASGELEKTIEVVDVTMLA